MAALIIDRQALPESLLSFIGAPRIAVSAESGRVVLTPAVEEDGGGPDEYDIGVEPGDYPDTTAYLNAIPGYVESLLEMDSDPETVFTPAGEESFRA
jgi:hypothetical protein